MKKILTAFLFIAIYLSMAKGVLALTFDLIAPTEELQRGQDVKFAININTEGKSYTTSKIGMTYETQYLEYVSVSAGDTFTTITADPQGNGSLIISGNSAAGFSGSGTFAYVTFKLIATGAGSTELCALFNPDTPTPTPQPNVPQPTALPTSGEVGGFKHGLALGLVFFVLAGSGLFVFKNL